MIRAIAISALILLGLGLWSFDRWVARTELPLILTEVSTEVQDRNGTLLRAYTVENGRWRLAPGKVDPRFAEMLLRYEDKRFWTHSGVDWIAMSRSLLQAVRSGRVVSGGSTLTMQVARLLENGSTGRWPGKLRQVRMALALERKLTKQEILQLYFTHAPYGGNLEGVRAASLVWFGKEPTRLTPAQAALLVALPQAPEGRRPDRHPQRAKGARDRVLARLAAQGVLPKEEATAALREPIPTTRRPFPKLAAHMADRALAEHPDRSQHSLTLDAELQQRLEHLAQRAADKAGTNLSIAIVAADLNSGDILASVGSAGYGAGGLRQGYVDMSRAVRSPGSTLKPLVYGLAFDQGLAHPETLIHDGPVHYGRYAPQNFDGAFRGDVQVRKALQMSLNIPVVKLTSSLGPARLVSAMNSAGMQPDYQGTKPGLAIALGGVGVRLDDLVQLYAVLGAGGQGPRLRWQADDPRAQTPRVLSPASAWQVTDILRGLAPPKNAPPNRIAYKTGTSYGHRDAWAIGYDGAHVIGVWMGRPDGTSVPGVFGGDLAAPVLFDAFGRLKPDFESFAPPPPETLILSTADLPTPLQRFRPRGAVFAAAPQDAPKLIFPPDGAQLLHDPAGVTIKLRGGQAPFTILRGGLPIARNLRDREITLPDAGRGYATLVVLDARGHSDRVTVRVD